MAPSHPTQQVYAKDEKVLCFHHELLYEAKILDSKLSDPTDKKSQMLYRVHYKGWKNTWDDWVSGERIRKLTEENKELAQNLKKDLDAQRRPAATKSTGTKKKNSGSDKDSNRGSEERNSSAPAGRAQKRGRDYDIEQEEAFYSRAEVRITIPEMMKNILVDDWEKVTKDHYLARIPSKRSVTFILDQYFEEEKTKRRLGSAEADLLEEVVVGVKIYFSRALSPMLLYLGVERIQYHEAYKATWGNPANLEWEGKTASDVYGAEHLARLFSKFPELLAHSNLDRQAMHRLREELTKMLIWLNRNCDIYFNIPYEPCPQEWHERWERRGDPPPGYET